MSKTSLQSSYDTSAKESRVINLLVSKISGARLHAVAEEAQKTWTAAWPSVVSRTHLKRRVDSEIRRPETRRRVAEASSSSRPSEASFSRQLHRAVAAQMMGCQGRGQVLDVPEAWSEGHEREQMFQNAKLRKRIIEDGGGGTIGH